MKPIYDLKETRKQGNMLIFNCTKAASEFFSKSIIKNGKKQISRTCESPPHKSIAESETLFDNQFSEKPVKPWQWIVHAIKVDRKTVLIAMDHKTRFTIALTGIKKGDNAEFLRLFEGHLKVHIWELFALVTDDRANISTPIDNHFKQFNNCAFYNRGDRSVQAHINDVVWHFKSYSESSNCIPHGEELISFDNFVNELLRTDKVTKEYFHPYHRFLHQRLIEINHLAEIEAGRLLDELKDRELQTHKLLNASPLDNNKYKAPANLDNVISLDKFRK